jgi:hypothetical protein
MVTCIVSELQKSDPEKTHTQVTHKHSKLTSIIAVNLPNFINKRFQPGEDLIPSRIFKMSKTMD